MFTFLFLKVGLQHLLSDNNTWVVKDSKVWLSVDLVLLKVHVSIIKTKKALRMKNDKGLNDNIK